MAYKPIVVKRDNGAIVTFVGGGEWSIKTRWKRQAVYTQHRPYQANESINYHDGFQSAECNIAGWCVYNLENVNMIDSLEGTIIRVSGPIEPEYRGYVKTAPTQEKGESLEFTLELTRV